MGRIVKTIALTSRAVKDLKKVKTFNSKLHGRDKVQEIIDAIFERLEILEDPKTDFTEIGAIDEDFSHLKYSYRKLIAHHCKITYREGKSKVYIIRVFDTRQHPNKNK